MQLKIKNNICAGIASILTGVVLYIMIPYCITAKRVIQTNAIGSDYLPRLVAVLFVGIGLVMLVQSIFFKIDKTTVINFDKELRVFALMGLFIVYTAVVKYAGFLITTVVTLEVMLLLLKCRKPLYYIIIAVLTAGVYFSLRYGLAVRLP